MLNKIQKEVKKGNYLYGVCKEHPKAIKYGYVLLHRLIIENHLNRYLLDSEIVHHKDGNKHNNNIENLEVMSVQEHSSLHNKTGRTFITLICPNCNKRFQKEKRQIKKESVPKCSRKCNGEYSRKIQLNLI